MTSYIKEIKYKVINLYKQQKSDKMKFDDVCENILERKGTIYIKYIAGSIMDFMNQFDLSN